ncbi:uncharacterized protein LOC119431098 [Dermacentor silvarum]|uniref:uncharacterized protein LOC119431098 n=1 Tax=Dermacentor silvarum TaxID=543639 RepID=UPI00189C0F45|nr:uncharacterized protein LOC119431098 [Dermacentor silvarum]
MEMPEAQPYRVAVANTSGGVEYRSVLFAGESPPKRLVCADCRTVSATDPRYARRGDVVCRDCALNSSRAGSPRGDGDDAAVAAGEAGPPSTAGGRLPPPQPFVAGDAELLGDLEVLCAYAGLNCDFKGKLGILSSHLSFTCTRHIVECPRCGQRVVHRDIRRHVESNACSSESTTAPTMEDYDPALVWAPVFLNWEPVLASRTNSGPTSPPPVVSEPTPVHRSWSGPRAHGKRASVPAQVRQGSQALTGTLLVRFPDITSTSGAGREIAKPAACPVDSSRVVEFLGSDQLVLDGFLLTMRAALFYDCADVSGLASSSTSLRKFVVFDLLALDVAGAKGDHEPSGHCRWPPARVVVLTLNGFHGVDSGNLVLRAGVPSGDLRWAKGGGWTKVAVTESIDAEVVRTKFLAVGVVDVTVEFT